MTNRHKLPCGCKLRITLRPSDSPVYHYKSICERHQGQSFQATNARLESLKTVLDQYDQRP